MTGRGYRLVLLATLAGVVLGQAQAAAAGTVLIVDSPGLDYVLRYVAGPGETNHVTIEEIPSIGGFYVSDTGAPLIAGRGCSSSFPHFASCHISGDPLHPEFDIELGDLNDVVSTSWYRANVRGGEGDDVITGNYVRDRLFGGPGNDTITGYDGADILFGGPGNDTINGNLGADELAGQAGDDTLTGGPGSDRLLAVGMNLRLTPTALVGQGSDTLRGIEWAELSGGNGNNIINARTWRGRTHIRARGGNDVIVGGIGRDVVSAGVGDDRVAGGAGRDLLAGEAGNDLLFSRDRQPDQVSGGPGLDRAHVDRIDTTRQIEAFPF